MVVANRLLPAPVFDLTDRDAVKEAPDWMIEAYHKRDSVDKSAVPIKREDSDGFVPIKREDSDGFVPIKREDGDDFVPI